MLNFMQTGVAFSFLRVRTSALLADADVSAKLAEELVYEKEAAIEGEPEFLKEFRNSGIWTVCSFFFFLWGDLTWSLWVNDRLRTSLGTTKLPSTASLAMSSTSRCTNCAAGRT